MSSAHGRGQSQRCISGPEAMKDVTQAASRRACFLEREMHPRCKVWFTVNIDIGCLGVDPDTCKTTYCTLHERSSKDRVQTAHLSLAPKRETPLFSQLHCPAAICDSSNMFK